MDCTEGGKPGVNIIFYFLQSDMGVQCIMKGEIVSKDFPF